jgi:hypothetical protein
MRVAEGFRRFDVKVPIAMFAVDIEFVLARDAFGFVVCCPFV